MTEHELFAAALPIYSPSERAAYLDRECGGDEALRKRVEALLAAYSRAGSFLNVPAVAGHLHADASDDSDGAVAAVTRNQGIESATPASRISANVTLAHANHPGVSYPSSAATAAVSSMMACSSCDVNFG